MPTPDENPAAVPSGEPPEEEDTRTIGQILGLAEAAPLPAPGFAAMADSPEELADPTTGVKPPRPGQPKPPAQPPGPNPPEPASPPGQINAPRPVSDPTAPPPDPNAPAMAPPAAELQELNDQRRRIYDEQRGRYPGATTERLPITPADEDISRGNVRYESRIQIVDAWQYPGRLSPTTPDWIDRNWVGYADDDPVRQIAAGPCLRVPSPYDPAEVVLARIGDYVCRQQVLTDDGGPPVIRTEVWAAEQFQRLFVPVPVTPGRFPVAEDTAGTGTDTAPARPVPSAKQKSHADKPKSTAVKSSRQRRPSRPAASRPAA